MVATPATRIFRASRSRSTQRTKLTLTDYSTRLPKVASRWRHLVAQSSNKTARIRALNDALRQNLTGGRAVLTRGVAALGQAAGARIIKTIAVFDDFCQANDPYQEHDFGAFEAEGHTIFFKVDYFDTGLACHSPDPADPAVTERVLTIMLSEEY